MNPNNMSGEKNKMMTRDRLIVGVTLIVIALAISIIGPLFFHYTMQCKIKLDERPYTATELTTVQTLLEQSIWLPEKRSVNRKETTPPTFTLRMRNVNLDNVNWLLTEQMAGHLEPQKLPWENNPVKNIGIRLFPYLSPVGFGLVLLALFYAFWLGRGYPLRSKQPESTGVTDDQKECT